MVFKGLINVSGIEDSYNEKQKTTVNRWGGNLTKPNSKCILGILYVVSAWAIM